MSLQNVGPEPVDLTLNQPLFTVAFHRLDEPAPEGYTGKHQDQNDFPADQYDFILTARTTSLAEIPTLREQIARLNVLIEELEERLPDPDAGSQIKPEIEAMLSKSLTTPTDSLLRADKAWEKSTIDRPMGLLFHPDALARLPKQDAKRIKDKIDWLWTNRYIVNHFPLSENLSGFYKRRVGRY